MLGPKFADSYNIYRIAVESGTMAAGIAAGSPVVAVNWKSATKLFLLLRAEFTIGNQGTGFTAGGGGVGLHVYHGGTTNTGGNAIDFSTLRVGQLDSTQPRSELATSGELRHSTTAALTLGGSPTLQSQFGQYRNAFVATAGYENMRNLPLYDANDYLPPLVLRQDQQLAVRLAVPATGTWLWSCTLTWAERTV